MKEDIALDRLALWGIAFLVIAIIVVFWLYMRGAQPSVDFQQEYGKILSSEENQVKRRYEE